jgi:hypothetical protein
MAQALFTIFYVEKSNACLFTPFIGNPLKNYLYVAKPPKRRAATSGCLLYVKEELMQPLYYGS